jgi:lipopolysaccharide export system permease protein
MFAAGMLVVVVLLILGTLFEVAATIIAKGISPVLVMKYLAFRMPEAFSRGMPIALLFAVLLSLTRLTQDSELKAAITHGVPPGRLALPVLIAGGIVAVLAFLNAELLVPRGFVQAQRTMKDIILSNPRVLIQEGVFFTDAQGQQIHVKRVLDGGQMEGITVIQANAGQIPRRVTTAPTGAIMTGEGAIQLRDGMQVTYRNGNPRPSTVFRFREALIPIRDLQEGGGAQDRPIYQPLPDLIARVNALKASGSPAGPEETALHRKFAEPMAAIAFALFGVAVSLFALRARADLGFVGVMLLTFLYYATWTVFRVMGESGALWPPLAAWAPDVLYAGAGLGLLALARRR